MCIHVAGKKQKSRSELPAVTQYLQELERSSEEKQEDTEIKRKELELEAEKRRQQAEWNTKERRWEAHKAGNEGSTRTPNTHPPPAGHQLRPGYTRSCKQFLSVFSINQFKMHLQ